MKPHKRQTHVLQKTWKMACVTAETLKILNISLIPGNAKQ